MWPEVRPHLRTFVEREGQSGRPLYAHLQNDEGKWRSPYIFAFVEETFKGMRDDYAVVNHNCGHWARQMFTKLIDPAVDNDMRIRQETEKLKKALFNFTNFP